MSLNPIKGGTFSALYVRVADYPAKDLADAISRQVTLSPSFFADAPLVLSLEDTEWPENDQDLIQIIESISDTGLMVAGIAGGNENQIKSAKLLDLPVFNLHRGRNPAPASEETTTDEPVAHETTQPQPVQSRIVKRPVRSGTQVYAQYGDLILMNALSSGAEAIADGNIHIYGPARGRVVAGASGDESAMIFCDSLEAEMVAIAGRYLVSEALEGWLGKSVMVSLREEQLLIQKK